MIDACKYVLGYIAKSPNEFLVDGNVVSLYGLMEEFNKVSPPSVTRYKGLGEMNGDQLFNSTLDPSDKGNRVLIRYTLEDIKYELDKMKDIEDDKLQLMKDVDVTQYVF